MIFTALIVGTVVAQNSETPSPSKLISTMLAKYAAAKTVVGTIKLTQAAGSESGVIETSLQFERPGKLVIRQVQAKSPPRVWLVTCDGKHFSYDPPSKEEGARLPRLVESVKKDTGTMKLEDVYRASVLSLGDRSAPLDLVIGHREDLVFVTGQWATLTYGGKVKLGEADCHKIRGTWKEFPKGPAAGRFELWLDGNNEIRRYVVEQNVVVDANLAPLRVVSVWDVNLKIGGTPDESLFKVAL